MIFQQHYRTRNDLFIQVFEKIKIIGFSLHFNSTIFERKRPDLLRYFRQMALLKTISDFKQMNYLPHKPHLKLNLNFKSTSSQDLALKKAFKSFSSPDLANYKN